MGDRWSVISILVIYGLCCPVGNVLYGAEKKSESSQLATFLLTGWRSEREKLVTGKVKISGTAQKKGESRDIRVSLTFDHSRGMKKYRVYWKGNYDGWWLVRPELLAQCVNNSAPVVDVIKPTDRPLRFVRESFDPRCFGMNYISDLYHGVTFDHIIQRMLSPGLEQVQKIGEGLYRLEWRRGSDQLNSKLILVINEKKGFSFERFDVYIQVPRKGALEKPWYFDTGSTVEWEERNGTWVPTSITAKGASKDSVELKLDWESVNDPIPQEEFDLDHLGVPDGTLIGDRRLSSQNPIVIGKVNQGNLISHSDRQITKSRPVRTKTIVILVIDLALVLIIIFLFLIRRWKKKAIKGENQ